VGKEKEVLQAALNNREEQEDTGPKMQQLQQEILRLKVEIERTKVTTKSYTFFIFQWASCVPVKILNVTMQGLLVADEQFFNETKKNFRRSKYICRARYK
jgi:hypothetical protein